MKGLISVILIFLVIQGMNSQKRIMFPSVDSVPVTADLFMNKEDSSYILLFHQAEYSRGEYRETAPKFLKFGYNCLAVDLRSGDEVNFIQNETHKEAIARKLPTNFIDSKKDIYASINYAYSLNKKPVVIIGSSYSASLCLIAAKNNPKVKAVVAFSPGEYFENDFLVRDSIAGLEKPVFVTGTVQESAQWKELFSKMDNRYVFFFKPQKSAGVQGSKALWKSNKTKTEYWIELMMFFRKLF